MDLWGKAKIGEIFDVDVSSLDSRHINFDCLEDIS